MFGEIKFTSLKVGDVIVYEAFGTGKRRVKIRTLEPEIKNDYTGFTGHWLDAPADRGHDNLVWGYTFQIIKKEQENE